MDHFDVTSPSGWLAIGILVIGYFLADAHKSIKASIKEKADKIAMDEAFRQHAGEIQSMRDQHADDMARSERQNTEWRSVLAQQVTTQMAAMERNLSSQIATVAQNQSERIDMVLKIIERRHGS